MIIYPPHRLPLMTLFQFFTTSPYSRLPSNPESSDSIFLRHHSHHSPSKSPSPPPTPHSSAFPPPTSSTPPRRSLRLIFIMMFSFTSVVTLATLISTAFSSPINERATPKEFKLQTRIVNNKNDTGTFKGKLYVSSYHTGAGLSDAVLVSNASLGVKGYLNETVQEFDLGTDFPYYFAMGGDANYAAWEPVQINAFDGINGFSLNSSGLQWNASYGFGGWLACDWFHGVPQLFWLNEYYQYSLPTSCSQVNLVAVPV